MMKEIIKYVNHSFNKTKQRYNHVNDVVLKSALVYQFLCIKYFARTLSVSEILELNNGEINLIRPGSGCLTFILERVFGQIKVVHAHAILHDAFGRFYKHWGLDRGYSYAIPETVSTKFMKRSPLCGQILGLIYCLFKRITI